VERACLLAKVVTSTDNFMVPGTNEPWIGVKRRNHLEHKPCEAVLIIERDRIEVRVDVRTVGAGSPHARRSGVGTRAAVVGLRCLVADLYEGTPLHPRAGRSPKI
jgi:hypothetical protein